jgi:hypothetical protein
LAWRRYDKKHLERAPFARYKTAFSSLSHQDPSGRQKKSAADHEKTNIPWHAVLDFFDATERQQAMIYHPFN